MNPDHYQLHPTPDHQIPSDFRLVRATNRSLAPRLFLTTALVLSACTPELTPATHTPEPTPTRPPVAQNTSEFSLQHPDVAYLIDTCDTFASNPDYGQNLIRYDSSTTPEKLNQLTSQAPTQELSLDTIGFVTDLMRVSSPDALGTMIPASCDLLDAIADHELACQPTDSANTAWLNLITDGAPITLNDFEATYTRIGELSVATDKCLGPTEFVMPTPDRSADQTADQLRTDLDTYPTNEPMEPHDAFNEIINHVEDRCPDWPNARQRIFKHVSGTWAMGDQIQVRDLGHGLINLIVASTDPGVTSTACNAYQVALDQWGCPRQEHELWARLAEPSVTAAQIQTASQTFQSQCP